MAANEKKTQSQMSHKPNNVSWFLSVFFLFVVRTLRCKRCISDLNTCLCDGGHCNVHHCYFTCKWCCCSPANNVFFLLFSFFYRQYFRGFFGNKKCANCICCHLQKHLVSIGYIGYIELVCGIVLLILSFNSF